MKSIVSAVITCPGTMIGKAGRIGDDEVGRDQLGAVLQPLVDLRTAQRQIFALSLDVGAVEGRAHVAFARFLARILAERVVEVAEIGQVGHVVHQRLHPRREGRPATFAAVAQAHPRSRARSRRAPG